LEEKCYFYRFQILEILGNQLLKKLNSKDECYSSNIYNVKNNNQRVVLLLFVIIPEEFNLFTAASNVSATLRIDVNSFCTLFSTASNRTSKASIIFAKSYLKANDQKFKK
jgi:hypothetical protein